MVTKRTGPGDALHPAPQIDGRLEHWQKRSKPSTSFYSKRWIRSRPEPASLLNRTGSIKASPIASFVPWHSVWPIIFGATVFRTATGSRSSARNSLEWMTAYVAGHLSGAIVTPVRASLPPDLLKYVLADCGASLAIVQGPEQFRQLSIQDDQLPQLCTILSIEELHDPQAGWFSLSSILYEPISASAEQEIRDHTLEIEPDAVGSICYTTCADGRLRGAVFNRGQIVKTLLSMAEWLKLDEDDLGFTTPQPWSELPHLNSTLHYFISGVANALAEGDETSFEDLQHISPTVTLTTPYAFEYIYLQVMSEMEHLPRSSQEVFQWALTVGKDFHAAGLSASPELRESYQRADMTFFNNIRGMMGGRLRRFYSAGAPLSRKWVEFAEAIGILPLNVYSLTKAGGFPAVSRPSAWRAGSCGQIAPNFQIRIDDDSEILVRGETVMCGYWGRPGDTCQVLDADGWLHTGDLGRFDSDGYLYITGHKRSLIVLATGRKVIPALIEQRLTGSPYIAQALIFGDGRRYLSALIVPDFATAKTHLQGKGLLQADQTVSGAQSAVADLIDRSIREINMKLDGWEQIEQYTILDQPFTDANGQPFPHVSPGPGGDCQSLCRTDRSHVPGRCTIRRQTSHQSTIGAGTSAPVAGKRRYP